MSNVVRLSARRMNPLDMARMERMLLSATERIEEGRPAMGWADLQRAISLLRQCSQERPEVREAVQRGFALEEARELFKNLV